jgi:hypothetical protein
MVLIPQPASVAAAINAGTSRRTDFKDIGGSLSAGADKRGLKSGTI